MISRVRRIFRPEEICPYCPKSLECTGKKSPELLVECACALRRCTGVDILRLEEEMLVGYLRYQWVRCFSFETYEEFRGVFPEVSSQGATERRLFGYDSPRWICAKCGGDDGGGWSIVPLVRGLEETPDAAENE